MGSSSNYREYSDRRWVKQAIMQNNSTRFHLTEDTPPLLDPLLSDLGYLSIMEASRQILVGTYVCPPPPPLVWTNSLKISSPVYNSLITLHTVTGFAPPSPRMISSDTGIRRGNALPPQSWVCISATINQWCTMIFFWRCMPSSWILW